jgi:uncharacterized protein (DUF983 family)
MKPITKTALKGLMRGVFHRCPNCGTRSIYQSYLKVKDQCESCGLALKDYPADDTPPYMVISLVATIIVPLVFLTDSLFNMSELMLMGIWLPISVLFILLCLPPAKGSVIGVLWALGITRDSQK